MFADAFPALANSAPGALEEHALSALKNLVVVDDMPSMKDYATEVVGVKFAVDFKEILVWREHGSEDKVVDKMETGLKAEDVINLQFTRLVQPIILVAPELMTSYRAVVPQAGSPEGSIGMEHAQAHIPRCIHSLTILSANPSQPTEQRALNRALYAPHAG